MANKKKPKCSLPDGSLFRVGDARDEDAQEDRAYGRLYCTSPSWILRGCFSWGSWFISLHRPIITEHWQLFDTERKRKGKTRGEQIPFSIDCSNHEEVNWKFAKNQWLGIAVASIASARGNAWANTIEAKGRRHRRVGSEDEVGWLEFWNCLQLWLINVFSLSEDVTRGGDAQLNEDKEKVCSLVLGKRNSFIFWMKGKFLKEIKRTRSSLGMTLHNIGNFVRI